jgi:hypothetical protein
MRTATEPQLRVPLSIVRGTLSPTATHAKRSYSLRLHGDPDGFIGTLSIRQSNESSLYLLDGEQDEYLPDGLSAYLLARIDPEPGEDNTGIYRVVVREDGVACSCSGDVTGGRTGRCKHAHAIADLVQKEVI